MRVSRREVIAGLASVPVLASPSAASLAQNVRTVSKLAGERPILAVIKKTPTDWG